ncbi:MAG TPA: hypothetical protein VFI42_01095 [Thermomicrobiaceae bacterium]|nr:hypothetical protein [Thermomicrobiaceae bacterium]
MDAGAQAERATRDRWLRRAEQGRAEAREIVVNRGRLGWGVMSVEYSTMQPSPAQWVAMAVMPVTPAVEGTSRMIVGTGASEFAAVEALAERLTRLLPQPEPPAQPSDWFGD